MPNEVYRAAVDGLSGLVPPRAARRLVDEALRDTHRTAEDVSLSAMRRLLLGPIRKELEAVLPPGAAGPGLKLVAAGLEPGTRARRRWWALGRQARSEPMTGPPGATAGSATPPAPALAAASRAAAVAGPSPAVRVPAARHEPRRADADVVLTGAELEATPAVAPQRALRGGGTAGRAPLPVLDERLVERALRAFGELETVRQVVAVRGDEVVLGSGDGVEPGALPALALATSRLLGRAGTLKLFALERASGALFLFPLQGGGLVVLTEPKVNIGAVLAARAALEEAA